jgi:hypothetical protein
VAGQGGDRVRIQGKTKRVKIGERRKRGDERIDYQTSAHKSPKHLKKGG